MCAVFLTRRGWEDAARGRLQLRELRSRLGVAIGAGSRPSARVGPSVVLGRVDWKEAVEDAVNSGKPVTGAVVRAIVLPTLVFVAAGSIVGFASWRLQRELWRRDIQRLGGPDSCGRP